jgi:hypothetical protein
MTQDEFERTINAFDGTESMRGNIYYRVLDLIKANFVVEAHLLFLSTWNFARFRYVITSFDLPAYEALLQNLSDQLQPLARADFASVNFDQYREMISDSFDRLAAVNGVEFTGAAKVLHLLNPRVFLMWDSAISGWHTPRADYHHLQVVRSGFWTPPNYRFARSGTGYHDFLVYCQSRFSGLVSPSPRKTLAKCIDEFNYCSITKCLADRGGHNNQGEI